LHIFEAWKSIHYRPAIYDPSGIGWTITAAYFLAAFLCLWTGLAEKKRELIDGDNTNYLLWYGLAGLMSIIFPVRYGMIKDKRIKGKGQG